jgi:hypothetical protein
MASGNFRARLSSDDAFLAFVQDAVDNDVRKHGLTIDSVDQQQVRYARRIALNRSKRLLGGNLAATIGDEEGFDSAVRFVAGEVFCALHELRWISASVAIPGNMTTWKVALLRDHSLPTASFAIGHRLYSDVMRGRLILRLPLLRGKELAECMTRHFERMNDGAVTASECFRDILADIYPQGAL